MTTDPPSFKSLPRAAARCIRLALPVLERFFKPDRFIIGCGSALAARWHHRVSMDVDLFTESLGETKRLHGAEDKIRAAIAKSCGRPVPVGTTPQHGQIIFSADATLEWSAVPRLTPEPVPPDSEPISGLRLDSVEEILAQKLYSRMYLNGGNLIRDVCDLAWAAKQESPNLLLPAIRAFRSAGFETMLDVLGDIRAQLLPVNRDRPIGDPADPHFEFEALDVLCRHLENLRPPRVQRGRGIQR
ncbi:MAG: nucleotidyl transferase AbiEii/AbiGii toxin family protein [Bryobacterales bacterium]|nr:nucleotidyl transferase AbiEii/AbiGii toxin family protein [Bryobacterales bacterium]